MLGGLARIAAVSGLSLLVAACAPSIERAESGIALPDSFTEAAASPVRWPDPDWWRGFGSTELDDLVARLMTGNFDLAQAIARVRQADAQLRVANAALLPTVELDASSGRQRTALQGSAYIASSHSATVSASYEVDFWGRNRASQIAARENRRYAELDTEVVRLTQLASLAATYFELLEAEAELAVQRQNLAAAQRILAIVRARQAAGTATGLDVARQETAVAQEDAKIPPLEQTIAVRRNAIATLLGEAPERLVVRGGDFDRLTVPRVAPGQPASLIARRPDVARAEVNLAAYNANIAAARAALLPTITLTGQAGWSAAALSTLVNPASQVWSISASLVQTVFDGGKRYAQLDLARAEAEEQLHAYRAAIIGALEEVESGIVQLRQSEEQERRLRIAVERADRAHAISEAQLRGGVADLATVLSTQQTLFSARVSLVQARLTTVKAAVNLFKVLGGGWR